VTATTFAWLVLLFPLIGTVVIALGWRSLPGRSAGWIGTLMIGLSFAASVVVFVSLLRHSPEHRQLTSTLWNYDVTEGVDAKLQILADPLSTFMILVVSGVSTLIHLYSVTYMNEDHGFRRYFS
jgi:NADH-quinone oxidoreductase subunit L